ncbi:MAG: hypothetical protein CSA36_06485 [Draconibacterium sp.]|nr:MAG: hypothetical protein CSA36_06485 [Draconibacterium sp.]
MDADRLHTLFAQPELLDTESAEELKKLTDTYPWFSLAWMLYAKNLQVIDSADFELVLKKAIVRVNNQKLFARFLSATTSPTVPVDQPYDLAGATAEGLPEAKNILIDRFLSSEHDLPLQKNKTKVVAEADDYQDIVERSATDAGELATETLANIYIEQKKFGKAIQVLEKLSLKYPEKSIYFATRIKETEELKNINKQEDV